METPSVYVPMDRRQAMARRSVLPERAWGATLFADISGFTPLTEALAQALGPQRGAEELTRNLNLVYDVLIAEVDRYGGSVIGFSGDAITCWLVGDDGRRATACGLAMQRAMQRVAAVDIPGGGVVKLAMKVAVAAGPVRRFVVGDPEIQIIDVLAGQTLDRLAATEHQAGKGEVVLDPETIARLDDVVAVCEWREDQEGGGRYAVAGEVSRVQPCPWPLLSATRLSEQQVRAWVLPPIYERVRSGRANFIAELRPAAALFLRFGGIDYDADPEAGARLDAYIRRVQAILARYESFVIQLTVGDKGSYLYAPFGAPLAHDDDARRAIEAALELQALSGEFSFIGPVQIGITQGRMRTGPYGGSTRRTYGVLGDEVNLAARLMQAAAPGEVLVSDRVRRAAGDGFDWEGLPPLKVKGKSEPVAVFRLAGVGGREAIRLQEPRYGLPMVGRDAELAVARQKLDQVLNGHGQVVGITAEAGMGKSRLVAEIIRLASERDLVGYGGECQSYGTNTAYLVWQPIWRAFFGLDATSPVDEQVRRLAEQLGRVDPSLVPRLPLLGVVLSLPIPDNDLTRSFDAKLRKASLEALLVDCLRARVATGSDGHAPPSHLLLVLDDVHWLDPLSHDLLETIARAIADLPVFIVLAYRPPELARLQALRVTQLSHFTEIRLADFTPQESEQLITLKLRQLVGPEAEIPAELLTRITNRAQGNPFYIEELLNYLGDRGIDPRDTAGLAGLDLPTSLHSLILSRIDQLTDSQKITLKVASIIGRVFQFPWLWGVYPDLGQPEPVMKDLDNLSRLDLTPLDQPEPVLTYIFKHVLTQEVAYESQPYATRAVLHDQLGRFIEQSYAGALEPYVDLLAHHYERSQNEAKKREYLRKAGEAAQGAYANTSAIDYYRRVLPLLTQGEQVEIRIRLGQVLELVGDWNGADEQYREALKLAGGLGDLAGQARAQRGLGWLLRKRGTYPEATTAMGRAQAIFEALGDPAGASQVMAEVGEVYRLQGAYGEARTYYDDSLRLAETVPLRELRLAARAQTLKGAGTLATWQGDYAAARRLNEESLAIRRELGDKPGVATLLNNLGIIARFQGDLETAHRMNDESLALFRELGDRWSTGTLLNNQACVASDRQEYGEARTLLGESLAIRRQLGDKAGLALSLNTLADVVLDEGDYPSARPLLAESLAINQELGDRTAIAYLIEDFGGLAAAEGQAERALRLAGFAAALRDSTGSALPPSEQARLDRMLEPARRALSEGAATQAWEEGCAMTLEQAIAYALEVPV